jgi:dTDP-4-amino-4,6-dideoxygalactose transaminase
MARLDPFVARRRELASRYDILLAKLPVTRPWQHPDTNSAWHLYVIRLNRSEIKLSRRQVFDALRAAGIGVNVHYIPVHTQPYYQKLGFQTGMFPEAESYYEDAITLPLFSRMTNAEQDTVVAALEAILS